MYRLLIILFLFGLSGPALSQTDFLNTPFPKSDEGLDLTNSRFHWDGRSLGQECQRSQMPYNIYDGMRVFSRNYLVHIVDNGLPGCSGMLISPRLVATAKHCTKTKPAGVGILGENLLYSRFVEVRSVHNGVRSDISLVELVEPLYNNHGYLELYDGSQKIVEKEKSFMIFGFPNLLNENRLAPYVFLGGTQTGLFYRNLRTFGQMQSLFRSDLLLSIKPHIDDACRITDGALRRLTGWVPAPGGGQIHGGQGSSGGPIVAEVRKDNGNAWVYLGAVSSGNPPQHSGDINNIRHGHEFTFNMLIQEAYLMNLVKSDRENR